MNSRSKIETKHIKIENTRNTLETPVWEKPTKRGLYWALEINITAAIQTEFSYRKILSAVWSLPQQIGPANISCTALFFLPVRLG
jgi:hypothetical protein